MNWEISLEKKSPKSLIDGGIYKTLKLQNNNNDSKDDKPQEKVRTPYI